MDNYLKINDLISFNCLNSHLVSIKDDFENSRGPFEIKDAKLDSDTKGLKVKIAATHAGIVTRNNMFYLPDKMKKAAPTFLEDYGKPVLKHHNERQDSIGRVIDAVYVDTSGVIKDQFKDLLVKDSCVDFSENSLQDFCTGRMPFALQIDFVRNYFNKQIEDNTFIRSGDYVGLGHIQIICDITDPDAIQKFLDGRFLTGSVGARTNRAVCSICKQDYVKNSECEHIPGAIYDGQKCVLIMGEFFYDEYSVVNQPADRQSRVLELYYNGETKNIEIQNEYIGNTREVKLYFPQYESKEERMSSNKGEKTEKIQDSVNKDIVVEEVNCEQEKSFVDLLDSLLKEDISDEDKSYFYDLVFGDQSNVEDVDWSKVSLEMEQYAQSLEDVEDTVLEGYEDINDATKPQDKPGGSNVGRYKKGPFCGPAGGAPKGSYPVNTRKRAVAALAYARNAPNPAGIKRCVCRHWPDLPACGSKKKDHVNVSKSAFCGPHQTFPVVDCEDVTLVKSALAKFKDKESVQKILANVDRKAKVFGCFKKTKDAIDHARVLQMLVQTVTEHMYTKKYRQDDGKEPVLNDDDVSALSSVMKNLVTMVGKDNFVSALSSSEQELKDVVKHFQDIDLLDEIISLEETVGELKDKLTETEVERDALKEEYDLIQKDNDSIRDELIDNKKVIRDLQVRELDLLTSLKDGEVTEDVKNSWLELSDEVVQSQVLKLSEEVDINKIVAKLNDGMSRVPEGEVEDPTLNFEEIPEDMQEKIVEINRKAFENFSDMKKADEWRRLQIEKLLSERKRFSHKQDC
jgi:hypothetical protein